MRDTTHKVFFSQIQLCIGVCLSILLISSGVGDHYQTGQINQRHFSQVYPAALCWQIWIEHILIDVLESNLEIICDGLLGFFLLCARLDHLQQYLDTRTLFLIGDMTSTPLVLLCKPSCLHDEPFL